MKLQRMLQFTMAALFLASCGGQIIDDAYQSCQSGDGCAQGTACLVSSLPAATFTGSLCTTSCSQASDCLVDLTNYSPECVNNQCYITCPTGGGNCPYGTQCLSFSDQNGNPINLCTP